MHCGCTWDRGASQKETFDKKERTPMVPTVSLTNEAERELGSAVGRGGNA